MSERTKRPSAKCHSMPGACSTVSAERPSLEEWSPQETVPGRRCLSAFAPVLLRSFQSSSWSNVLAHELQRGFGAPRLGEVVALPVLALQFKQAPYLPGTLNAFGNRFQVHLLRESGDQPQPCRRRRVRFASAAPTGGRSSTHPLETAAGLAMMSSPYRNHRESLRFSRALRETGW